MFMSQSVIRVEGLGKKFIIGHKVPERYTALRDVITSAARNFFSRKSLLEAESTEEFWALRDVNFDIQHGERVGIVGRNGAGKSTLLKILSRITEPSAGKVIIRGKVASLLEVGTGFHPELTGRENIYLNGAILGMSRTEIRKKFDEIVSFSEVERFLDTPVKRYSSGMYVRLAFAVAAHLEQEILIVDEVLAVGDARFQRKCLGKMQEVSSNEGRTVLFVSHNMAAMRALCNKGLFFDQGCLSTDASISEVIQRYEIASNLNSSASWVNEVDVNQEAIIKSIQITDTSGADRGNYLNSETVRIRLKVIVNKPVKGLKVGFDLLKRGTVVFRTQQVDTSPQDEFEVGEYLFDCEIPCWLLNVGEYYLMPLISIHMIKSLTRISDTVVSFSVSFDSSKSIYHSVLTDENHPGIIFPQLKWQIYDQGGIGPHQES